MDHQQRIALSRESDLETVDLSDQNITASSRGPHNRGGFPALSRQMDACRIGVCVWQLCLQEREGNSLLLRQLGGTANPCIIGAEPHNPRQQGLIRTMPPIGPSKGPGEFNARLNHILPENFPGDLSQPNSAGCM